MGAPVRVTRSLNSNSSFAQQVSAAAAKKAAKKMETVRKDAEAEIRKIITAEFVNDRPPERRKHGVHLLNSISVEMVWDGRNFPIHLVARSKAPKGAVAAQEFGSKPHVIFSKSGKPLAFPSTKGAATEIGRGGSVVRLENSTRPTSRGRAQAYGGTGRLARPMRVMHPGTKPHHFLRRGLELAVKKHLKSAR